MGISKSRLRIGRFGAGLLIAAALGAHSTVAGAQETVSTPVSLDGVTGHNQLFGQFDFLSISSIAGELGFRVSLVATPEGSPFYVLSDENQAQIVLRPMVCEGKGFESRCNALLMSMVLSGFPNASVARTNAFNDAQFFARTHMISDNQAVLSRFLIGEFGVVKGNLAIEVYSFRSAAYNFARYLAAQQMSANPGAPALGGGSLGILGSAQGALATGTDEALSPTLAMPGLDVGSESEAGIDTLIDVLEATHMMEAVTNDVSSMVAGD